MGVQSWSIKAKFGNSSGACFIFISLIPLCSTRKYGGEKLGVDEQRRRPKGFAVATAAALPILTFLHTHTEFLLLLFVALLLLCRAPSFLQCVLR